MCVKIANYLEAAKANAVLANILRLRDGRSNPDESAKLFAAIGRHILELRKRSGCWEEHYEGKKLVKVVIKC